MYHGMYMDELAAGALQKWVTAIALRGERISACTGDANSRRIEFTIEIARNSVFYANT
jgi:hypothetical protein